MALNYYENFVWKQSSWEIIIYGETIKTMNTKNIGVLKKSQLSRRKKAANSKGA